MLPINNPEAYFGRLIGQLEARANAYPAGASAAPVRDDNTDPIAEAVDFRLRRGTAKPFAKLDAPKLKQLCLQVHESDDVPALRAQLTSTSLAPEWIDLLAVVAYARRHIATLEHLVTTYSAPARPSFDRFASTQRYPSAAAAALLVFHDGPSRLTLIRIWTVIVRNSWAHPTQPPAGVADEHDYRFHPDWWSLRLAVLALLHNWTAQDAPLRASVEVASLLDALDRVGVVIPAETLAQLLTANSGKWYKFEAHPIIPVGIETATNIITKYFPQGGFKGEDAIAILLPLAMVDTVADPDRLQVMRMVLDAGCAVNALMRDSHRNDPYGYDEFLRLSRWQQGTVLHVAAERGDMEMVELLLARGARADIQGYGIAPPAQVARDKGHREVAERIEREKMVQDGEVRVMAEQTRDWLRFEEDGAAPTTNLDFGFRVDVARQTIGDGDNAARAAAASSATPSGGRNATPKRKSHRCGIM